MEDVLVDLIEIRKELCAHYELNARNLSQYADQYLRIKTIEPLFPDIAEKYESNSSITLTLNSVNATEAMNQTVLKSHKVTFKKDSAEI